MPRLLLLAGALAVGVRAEETQVADPVVVYGREAGLIGEATAASEGQIGAAELAARPFLRRGELLEAIPGVIITQHSGDGKANQYFLRGFDLDHGTDFATTVDGLPVNMPSNAHGQGYSDLNFIIPEFVQSISYEKGTYFAENGDFSAAGAAQFHLTNSLPRPFIKLEIGDGDLFRVVTGQTIRDSASHDTTLGVEAGYNNGPWAVSEAARHASGLVRDVRTIGDETLTTTIMGYHADWRSTDQVPARAISNGTIGRYGAIDPTDGGVSTRATASEEWAKTAPDSTTRVQAYFIFYQLSLFSDFTYFLDDPIHGDQFNQRDRRGVVGLNASHSWNHPLFGAKATTSVGFQSRYDIIRLDLDHTQARALMGVVRSDSVHEPEAGLYLKSEIAPLSWLKIVPALRVDSYEFDVDSDDAANSGTRTASVFSPKLNLVFDPLPAVELYWSAGLGFHSNDARGVLNHQDAASGESVASASPLVRARGLEAGLRTTALKGLVSTVSVWALDLDSELIYSGDEGGTEIGGPTRRYGVEWSNFYRVSRWLGLDADLALTRARYRDKEGDEPHLGRSIPNSIGTTISAGLVAGLPLGWFGSLRVRYFGTQPLVEDGSQIEPASTTVNSRIGWRNRHWEFALDILNLLDSKNDDIAYFYASRLRGEPTAGVDDVHLHPAEPREVRLSVTRYW